MKKQMNEILQQEGGDVLFDGQGGQFHMMDQEGLTTLHMAKQQEFEMNIEKRNWKYKLTWEFIRWSSWS